MQKRLHEAVFLTKRQLAFEQVAEFVVEFVHTTGSVDDFLSTGVERVAQGANLNVEAVFFHCGFGHEFVAARAGNVGSSGEYLVSFDFLSIKRAQGFCLYFS